LLSLSIDDAEFSFLKFCPSCHSHYADKITEATVIHTEISSGQVSLFTFNDRYIATARMIPKPSLQVIRITTFNQDMSSTFYLVCDARYQLLYDKVRIYYTSQYPSVTTKNTRIIVDARASSVALVR
jgi:hypothetical protein